VKAATPRAQAGRAPGGQPGHAGHGLAVPANLGALAGAGLAEWAVVDHTDGADGYISRWTVDIKVVAVYTGHRFARCADIPEGMAAPTSCGDHVQSLCVLLWQGNAVARGRAADVVPSLANGLVSPSGGAIDGFAARMAGALDAGLEAIRDDLLAGPVMHAGETPLRCVTEPRPDAAPGPDAVPDAVPDAGSAPPSLGARSRLVCMRNHSNENSAFFTINPHKDMEGVAGDNILPRYEGVRATATT
jgi:hypothetical protein